jgi:hypothetical protein
VQNKLIEVDESRRFDKIPWSDFEQPEGAGQDARSNPPSSTSFTQNFLEKEVPLGRE